MTSITENEKPLPSALLAKINCEDKKICKESGIKQTLWQSLDDFIPNARNEVKLDWPDSVFMPFGLWPCFLEKHYQMPARSFDLQNAAHRGMAQALSCLAPWRATQDIVRFDPEIETELKSMDAAGKLPGDILLRLPAWCVYIDVALTVDGDDYDGFFVHLDTSLKGVHLALTFQGQDRRQQRIPLLIRDVTLGESIAAVNEFAKSCGEPVVNGNDPGIAQAVNLVTYLCAYGLGDTQNYAGRTGPKPQKTKKGWRIFPPDKPKTHLLGAGFGEQIRREGIGSGGNSSKRPHVRRPHWHHFWKGSKAEKSLVVHWLPPILVGNIEAESCECHGNGEGGKACA